MMWLIISVPILFFIILFAVYFMAFYSNPRKRIENPYDIPSLPQYRQGRERMRKLISDFLALPCEHIRIQSHDGLTLHARFYPGLPNAPVEILCHGYRGSAIRDFCGGSEIGLARKHNIILIDQRAHGASSGSAITFGILERLDVLSWIHYARERFGPDTPIFLAGVSMGAATVLMATELELPSNVVGVYADCPFSSPYAIIQKVAGDMHLPAPLLMPFARLSARLFGGFSLTSASAVEAVKHSKIPILIIHGEDDRFVPCDMSREIRAANPDRVTLHTFPDAGHGLSYIVDTPRYVRAVADFEDTLNLF